MEFRNILGVDINPNDALFTSITFQELIDTVNANCKTVDEKAVRKTFNAMLTEVRATANYLLARNMDKIVKAAKG